MYVPSVFAQSGRLEIERFVDRHPLATLVGLVDGRVDANHLPFMRVGDLVPGERMIAHAARANPVWRLGESHAEVLLVFAGADAYVSPSYYPGKAEHHQVVPTYNYAAVHVRGRLTCSHERADRLKVVELLTNRMESSRPDPWAVTDAPAAYLDRMLDDIVALSLEILSVQAKWKASQNRTPADRAGVVTGLRADATGPGSLEAAGLVEQSLEKP